MFSLMQSIQCSVTSLQSIHVDPIESGTKVGLQSVQTTAERAKHCVHSAMAKLQTKQKLLKEY